MENQNCIRERADHQQISRCKSSLSMICSNLEENATFFNLIGNDVRIKILYFLFHEKELCPCDLSDILEMKIPAVSQHLRKLKDNGMIVSRREGQTIYYSLALERYPALKNILQGMNQVTVAL